MLRTPLYCLMSVCQSKSFCDKKQQVIQIKDGIKKYLKTDAYELLKELKVIDKLNGWR